ncbi:MAG: AAA family ATPase, partial [Oscillospiraceae bacterium]
MENEKTLNQTREYTPQQEALLQKLEDLIAEKNSAAEVGRLIGIKQPVLSALRKGNYAGDLDRQFGIIADYFKVKEEAVKNYKPVKYAPISTSNLAYQTIRNIQIMGGFGIVVGDPGVGKTKAVLKYAEDNPESCIAVKAGACTRGTRAVLKQVALKLNVPVNQSIDDMYMSIEAKLHDGMLIVVDEAQHLSFNAIEALRQISDDFDERDQTCGVVLVGNHGIIERMEGGKTGKDYKQTVNRRWQLQELKTTDISLNDIKMIFPVLAICITMFS